MNKHPKCTECNEIVPTLYRDPRVPPLKEEECPCHRCYALGVSNRAGQLSNELQDLLSQFIHYTLKIK